MNLNFLKECPNRFTAGPFKPLSDNRGQTYFFSGKIGDLELLLFTARKIMISQSCLPR